MALVSMGTAGHHADQAHRNTRQAERLARAGLLFAVSELQGALERNEPLPTNVGSDLEPRQFRRGTTWATMTNLGNGVLRVVSMARSGRSSWRIEAIVEAPSPPLYDYAVFAGNTSGDSSYSLDFGGVGEDGDQIMGSVYSAGNVAFNGDAEVTGSVYAGGTIGGVSGETGHTETPPDLSAMLYETTSDYDVAAMFADAVPADSPAGGIADQLPASNPAHIFRRNPDDRDRVTSETPQDDYFLEDPYEEIRKDWRGDGSECTLITLAGNSGEDTVFYIDGNLWVHSEPSLSFRFVNESGEPVRVTFVVKGNITFGDNLFYNDNENDAVAFIALTDPDVPDSGNIYFGDEQGGTLKNMYCFMHAENDFVDYHLDADGSSRVNVYGNMTAGNQVRIIRDFEQPDGQIAHSRLTVDFDERISNGAVELKGVPTSGQSDGTLAIRMLHHRTLGATSQGS